MSLFEIELNEKFKLLNSNVFWDEKKFKEFYQLNCLNDTNNDNIENYINEYRFKIEQDLFLTNNDRYEFDEINNMILSNIYNSNANSTEHLVYPEWLLFILSIKKEKIRFINEKEFHEYLHYFKYIAEIRYKKYIIRNVHKYICFNEYKNISKIKISLHNSLLVYLKKSKYETNELYEYLNFLYRFHQELKDNEKYKLMWNIEIYIQETIVLLLDKEISLKEIYEEVSKYMGCTYSVLHEIYIYKPLYVEESKNHFEFYLTKINKLFNSDIDINDFMSILTRNDKHENILFSCIELDNRFNANKMNEHLMGTIARSIVLSVEELIKDYKEERKLLDCLKSLSEDEKLFESYIIEGYNSSDELLELLDKLICDNEQSLEQYLAIYLASRNYLAHYNIDMNKFFWGVDGERRIISNTISSVIVILYRIEKIKEELRKTNE